MGRSVFGSASTFSRAVRASKPPTTLTERQRKTVREGGREKERVGVRIDLPCESLDVLYMCGFTVHLH